MKRHVITGLFLLAALACYAVSFGAGVFVFLAAGLVFELVFWGRLLRVGETARR
jgi:hypothetical protein